MSKKIKPLPPQGVLESISGTEKMIMELRTTATDKGIATMIDLEVGFISTLSDKEFDKLKKALNGIVAALDYIYESNLDAFDYLVSIPPEPDPNEPREFYGGQI